MNRKTFPAMIRAAAGRGTVPEVERPDGDIVRRSKPAAGDVALVAGPDNAAISPLPNGSRSGAINSCCILGLEWHRLAATRIGRLLGAQGGFASCSSCVLD
jgi:hypothetical protein